MNPYRNDAAPYYVFNRTIGPLGCSCWSRFGAVYKSRTAAEADCDRHSKPGLEFVVMPRGVQP